MERQESKCVTLWHILYWHNHHACHLAHMRLIVFMFIWCKISSWHGCLRSHKFKNHIHRLLVTPFICFTLYSFCHHILSYHMCLIPVTAREVTLHCCTMRSLPWPFVLCSIGYWVVLCGFSYCGKPLHGCLSQLLPVEELKSKLRSRCFDDTTGGVMMQWPIIALVFKWSWMRHDLG